MDAKELEVRCDHCDAGFAVGTKLCVHCQRPLRRRARAATGTLEGAREVEMTTSSAPRAPSRGAPQDDPEEDAEEPPRSGLSGALIQVALVLGIMAMSLISRACGSS